MAAASEQWVLAPLLTRIGGEHKVRPLAGALACRGAPQRQGALALVCPLLLGGSRRARRDAWLGAAGVRPNSVQCYNTPHPLTAFGCTGLVQGPLAACGCTAHACGANPERCPPTFVPMGMLVSFTRCLASSSVPSPASTCTWQRKGR